VIHVSCGKALAALAKRPSQHLFADGYGHQDLERSPQYLPALRAFVSECFGS
jgi:hypothetical protein